MSTGNYSNSQTSSENWSELIGDDVISSSCNLGTPNGPCFGYQRTAVLK